MLYWRQIWQYSNGSTIQEVGLHIYASELYNQIRCHFSITDIKLLEKETCIKLDMDDSGFSRGLIHMIKQSHASQLANNCIVVL